MADESLPTARELMASPAFTLRCESELLEAIDQLITHGLPAAPVIDQQGKLCGMLTEKDCLRLLSSLTYDPEPGTGTVERYQSPITGVCEPGMDLFRVAELFLAGNFPVLPVVEEERLVGTISRAAMLRGIQRLRGIAEKRQRHFEQTAGRQADRPKSIEDLQKAAATSTTEQLTSLLGRQRH